MGAINRFNLQNFISSNNLVNYVETGTGEGMCLSYAKKFPFKKFISCEIHKEVFKNVVTKFSSEVEIHNSTSEEMFLKVLPTLEGNSLFFLDAHFPGADFHYSKYDEVKEYDIRLPLEKELNILLKYRKNFNDVIVIDDLRIYMNGPYTGGNWGLRDSAGSKRVGFIFDLLNEMNKQIIIDYADQGYVIAY